MVFSRTMKGALGRQQMNASESWLSSMRGEFTIIIQRLLRAQFLRGSADGSLVCDES
jgi:hypothetical protein